MSLESMQAPPGERASWSALVDAVERLAGSDSLDAIIAIVRGAARQIAGSDGATFVLREDDRCHYVDEDAIGPLWKGQKFPLTACISGWAMLNRQVAVVPDIYRDDRIPHDAYRPTFVNSLVMVPVGGDAPIAAIGIYWAQRRSPGEDELGRLVALARATATAIANMMLRSSLRTAAEAALAQAAEIRELLARAQAETEQRAKVEAQLRQSQKMEAIGNLTGGLAHDFNNLLGIVIGNLELLQDVVAGDAAAQEFVDEAMAGATRGADLTRRLLAFARQQPLAPRRIDVNGLVSDICRLLSRLLGEQVEITLELGTGIWPVIADAAQLESAIANLATNARDAMPCGGRLTLVTANRHLDADYASQHTELAPGDYVMIEISDTGTGMPPEVLAHVFEPFFTTKEPGKGTGLGLAMVFGFMKQSGGHINVYSEVGQGTTFRLYLRRDGGAAADVAIEQPQAAAGGGETVLVVEDNAGVRRIVVRQLASLGYRVIEASGGQEALDVLAGTRIDLLFTDIVMPGGISGIDLADRVRRTTPPMKVLLTSGFPGANLNGGRGIPGLTLLTKPYRKEELARAVRQALDT